MVNIQSSHGYGWYKLQYYNTKNQLYYNDLYNATNQGFWGVKRETSIAWAIWAAPEALEAASFRGKRRTRQSHKV